MITHVRLPQAAFGEISTGLTGRSGMAALDAGHRSRQYLLLRMVVDRLPRHLVTGGATAEALHLLATVQRQCRTALDTVITYPYVGAGLVRCVRDLAAGRDAGSAGRYLASTAAAAAFVAGLDCDLDAVPTTGSLHLPGLGTAALGSTGSGPDPTPVRLRQRHGLRTVGPVALPADPATDSAQWSGLRWLAGRRTEIGPMVLDDLDPDRGAGGLSPTDRLTLAEFAAWEAMFSRALTRLDGVHPDWAVQVRHVLRAVTPLTRQRSGEGRSASTWQAYGAIAMTLPGDEFSLAATLVHEVQHSKLNGLINLVDLFDRADTSHHYSPWRADPRPLRGLLHGCYAFLGVAAFWAGERATGTGSRRADYEFARAVRQVRHALDTLADAAALTPDGRDFVGYMARQVAVLEAAPVPDLIHYLAELAVDDHRVSWRLCSVVPDPGAVAAAVTAWRAGRDVPALPTAGELAPATETFVPNDRIRLWSRLASRPGADGGDEAEHLLAKGAPEAAARRYLDTLRRDPDSTAAWTGLALAAARTDRPDGWIWRSRPELVRAVHRALGPPGGDPPDPLVLAGWLASG